MKQLIIISLLFICSQGFSQQPVFSNIGPNIYSCDLTNCNTRFIGKSNVPAFYDIAFTPNGRLWGIYSGEIFQIDTINAAATFVGYGIAAEGVSLVALNDSVLLGELEDSLWAININTSQNYNLGDIGYEAAGDLSWLGNNLYMTAENQQLIKIVFNADYSSILSSTPVNSINNPIPLCDGLATLSINDQASLIGFCETGTYNISPIDGTFQPVCLNIGGDGAACISYPDALPINLLSFSYVLLNQSIQLQWQTTLEINSSYFSIERSTDGINFITIGKQAAAGNSNIIKQYAFIDNNPSINNYYRLQEIDKDGKFTYSNILLAKLPQIKALIVLGNPIQNNLQLQINTGQSQPNKLSIFDFRGRILKTLAVQNGNQNIDVSSLSEGVYIVQLIIANREVISERFIKSN